MREGWPADALARFYNGYDEDSRLDRDHCHRLEFLTTLHYLERVLEPGSHILDVGAGTGRYAFHLAERGHQVTARDIVPRHVEMMREKARASGTVESVLEAGLLPGGIADCFYLSHPDEIEELATSLGIEQVAHLAADGVAYLLRDRVNALDEEGFGQWLAYHLRTCEDPSLLGCSLHGLYIGRKR